MDPPITRSERRCSSCGNPIPESSVACALCLLDSAILEPDGSEREDHTPWFELPSDLPQPGEMVGNHELLNEIARGGMGVIYRARQAGRIVALKMILPHQRTAPEIIARFRSESEIIAGLDHPNILPIYEIGELDGAAYFSMKFAENGSLNQHAKSYDGKFREIASFMSKVAAAVHHAHQRGVLHRDLKPANILLDQNYEPLVSDFGLARRLQQDEGLTVSRSILGTPNYLSPEQARGETRKLTISSDLFSLGAILYELLVGRPPFVGDDPIQVLRQVAETDPRRPSLLRPNIPRDLEVICLKCLSKNPKDRYGSAMELAEDLSRWSEGRSISARPASPPHQMWRWMRRNPALALLASLLTLALIGIAVGSTIDSLRLKAANQAATTQLRNAYLLEARATRLTGLAGQRFDALDALKQAAKIRVDLDLRNEAASALALADLRPRKIWKARLQDIDPLAFDATLENYAVAEQPGVVSIRRVTDQTEQRRIVYQGAPARFMVPFSSDNRFLAIRHIDNNWTFWDLATEPARLALQLRNDPSGGITKRISLDCAFMPGSPKVAVSTQSGSCAISNLLNGSREKEFSLPERAGAISFSADGKQLAVSEPTRNEVLVFDVETGNQKQTLHASVSIVSLAWNPFGKELAGGDFEGSIHFWNPATGDETGTLTGPNSRITQILYSADGHYLISTSLERVVRLWDAKHHFLLSRQIGWGSDPIMSLSVKGDQLGVAQFGHPDACIFDLALEPTWKLVWSPKKRTIAGLFSAPSFNEDGSFLACSFLDAIRIYDVRRAVLVAELPIDAGPDKSISEKSVHFVQDDRGESLLISSRKSGLVRWPLTKKTEQELQLGPGVQIDTSPGELMTSVDQSNQRVVMTNSRTGKTRILPLNPGGNVVTIDERPGLFDCAISPDGA
jgi:eukaryotic-like serine/threonine-protein kinase